MINAFNLNKAIVPNSIPVIILKEISEPLSTLINLLFNTGDFPNCLKLAKVIPVYKKGDQKESKANFCPAKQINISKLIGKLLHNRLYKFLNQNRCLFNYQFGFWNHHFTNHTLISIAEKIKALDEGKFARGVFLDFQKASDTVNHKILMISKLEHYEIRGLPKVQYLVQF